ncbi:hypothetical protein [Cupriavidus metallidurans]|uniref:hypothetical protein n=1 Tax=Cupriavidus metallidurans TaxID=119219 RepID=UPI001CCF7AF8|nr:hypothetical protein [Cupriavidus metallidurans]UBM12790.1 hypothetical protein LAI70_27950 [Cupriavidus metallidurans]
MKLANGQEFIIIAELRDRPRKYIGFTYTLPLTDPQQVSLSDLISEPEQGIRLFDAVEVPAAELANLPALTYAKAVNIIEHAYYSGGDLDVMVLAYLKKGESAMLNYAEVQGYMGMPGSPWNKMSTEDMKWCGAENLKQFAQPAA